ncbi:MAG: alpha-glucan family phosphorylase [Prevotellaceae bacterium]|jgi:starch phosphorylase|nr:alpha-glucan family phosphorylase [Prevotellaceae bacterium]
MKIEVNHVNQPNWKEVSVKSAVPAGLKKLQELSQNLYWVWNYEVTDLFREIDSEIFSESGENPVLFLQKIDLDKLESIEKDEEFMKKLGKVYANFRNYIDQKPDQTKPSVAYFSMEYGLTDILKIYSGGLGVLAGDYLKEASDCNIDLTAVGFLYTYGYFTQKLSMDGQQIAEYDKQIFNIFNTLPIEQVRDAAGNPVVVEVPYPNCTVYANVWKAAVGRISLYLLDTENELNSEFDRSITHTLYGGDWENRIKQEFLLGIGGILTLKKLGIEKQVYHCNEGHAAFINVQRLADHIAGGLTFEQALEVVRASSLYTTHTPVPAGHDMFEEGLFHKYMSAFPEKLTISWEDFINMGRVAEGDSKFSMSVFACNTAQEVNGVSWLHGKVSRDMFQNIWKGYFPEELHVGYVTNGVHMNTWAASEWKKLYAKTFDHNFCGDQSNAKIWESIYTVPDEKIWDTRVQLKTKLVDYIKVKYKDNWLKNQGDPSRIVSVLEKISSNALTIGFARRFATYKRAHLLFTDLERLEKIVNNPNYPVQFIFAGKAHPADGAGQGLIKRIVEISRMPQFLGKIIFLENYDMRLARRLVSGVDIWLNTPTRPLEASGTSGEKALMNGILNFSVLDGWWLEGYVKGAGWALTEKRTYENQNYQDQLDAATIYNMLENEIVPLYYAKNSKGYSPEWVQYIKNSIAKIAPHFTTKRMLDDYIERFYKKLAVRSKFIQANDFAKAKEIAAWKQNVAEKWDSIEVISVDVPEKLHTAPEVGESHKVDIVLDVKGLDKESIGIECVVTSLSKDDKVKVDEVEAFNLVKTDGSKLYFSLTYRLERAGTFKFGFRMFPKNADLPHRQDFCYVRWI